ncbi:MAG: aldolase/citrate lyase family protein [Emcibacter sp.]|nr:aldolase/citrate lyase family protein [Emcibacter sp.]
MTNNKLMQSIHKGERLVSTMLSRMRNPGWARILAELPFDFMTIDMEHSPYSDSEVSNLVNVLEAGGMPTVVRIPRPEWHFVTRVFDSGASGVLAPYCETVEEVSEIVRAARLRPMKGRFADRAMTTREFPGDKTRDHLAEFNAGHVVMIGIESIPAVENLEAILDVGGIDVVFIGPADLSTSMGFPREYDRPEFDAMVRHIIEKCTDRNVQVAANFAELDQSVKWASEGLNLIIHAMDFRVLQEKFKDILDEINAAAGKSIAISATDIDI